MHAVKIVGWGMKEGVAYWEVANSWGKSWNGDGYFRIRRGDNLCGIEEHVCFSAPKVETVSAQRRSSHTANDHLQVPTGRGAYCRH